MASHPSFGRRVTVQSQSRTGRAEVESVRPAEKALWGEAVLESRTPVPANPNLPSVEQELREWRRTRQGLGIPWRPLSLMASLCFGIASFVLPDSVNDNVQWLLYALMAASLYAGFSKRRRQADRPAA